MSESAHPQYTYHLPPSTCCWLSAAANMQCSLSPHQHSLIVMPVLRLLLGYTKLCNVYWIALKITLAWSWSIKCRLLFPETLDHSQSFAQTWSTSLGSFLVEQLPALLQW